MALKRVSTVGRDDRVPSKGRSSFHLVDGTTSSLTESNVCRRFERLEIENVLFRW